MICLHSSKSYAHDERRHAAFLYTDISYYIIFLLRMRKRISACGQP
ncbi:hypothetical protein HMPREF1985_00678 [Mitsuokella sp. oral taxon 131 str. W9106]|nr:hypothetical protein HMPREF1985_00678 [Mitsuokella sp. oral taxon 131 str. W9106]